VQGAGQLGYGPVGREFKINLGDTRGNETIWRLRKEREREREKGQTEIPGRLISKVIKLVS